MRILNNLPTSGIRLDAIKISALLAMLIAHVNVIYFNNSYEAITLLSRGWFSLFCYALACSILRIQDEKKDISPYLISLLILAAITQPFYNIGFDFDRANALFTLAAGAAFAFNIDKIPTKIKITLFLFAFVDASLFHSIWEYSIAGTLLPMTILMILRKQKYAMPSFLFMLFCANIAPFADSANISEWLIEGFLTLIFGVVGLILFFFIPLKLCPDKKGRLLPRYAMHIFYPGHLLILGLTAPYVKEFLLTATYP